MPSYSFKLARVVCENEGLLLLRRNTHETNKATAAHHHHVSSLQRSSIYTFFAMVKLLFSSLFFYDGEICIQMCVFSTSIVRRTVEFIRILSIYSSCCRRMTGCLRRDFSIFKLLFLTFSWTPFRSACKFCTKCFCMTKYIQLSWIWVLYCHSTQSETKRKRLCICTVNCLHIRFFFLLFNLKWRCSRCSPTIYYSKKYSWWEWSIRAIGKRMHSRSFTLLSSRWNADTYK